MFLLFGSVCCLSPWTGLVPGRARRVGQPLQGDGGALRGVPGSGVQGAFTGRSALRSTPVAPPSQSLDAAWRETSEMGLSFPSGPGLSPDPALTTVSRPKPLGLDVSPLLPAGPTEARGHLPGGCRA